MTTKPNIPISLQQSGSAAKTINSLDGKTWSPGNDNVRLGRQGVGWECLITGGRWEDFVAVSGLVEGGSAELRINDFLSLLFLGFF